jgi:phage tail sheath gpL-like
MANGFVGHGRRIGHGVDCTVVQQHAQWIYVIRQTAQEKVGTYAPKVWLTSAVKRRGLVDIRLVGDGVELGVAHRKVAGVRESHVLIEEVKLAVVERREGQDEAMHSSPPLPSDRWTK